MRPRILLTRPWPDEVVRRLRERYAVTVHTEDRSLDRAELVHAMRTFDAICPTVSDRLDEHVVGASGAAVRLIANYGVGHDHIALEAARRAGIVVTNTPGVLTEATAELAILLMLMVSRRAAEGERELRSGGWTGWRPTHLMGRAVRGKQLGLVGLGRIGRATAVIARQAFGMRIAYHSRAPLDALPAGLEEAVYYPSLDQLLAAADVVSLHCPGGADTYQLIDKRRLGLMKPTAILINTARGSVVEEQALADSLAKGQIAGAGLDVYVHEPRVNNLLLTLENVVLLPHLGSATIETRTAMGMCVADNLDGFFGGAGPPNRLV